MNLKLVSDNTELECPGVGRDAENDRVIKFYFNRNVSDEEMAYLYDVMQRAALMVLTVCRRPEGS